MEQEHNVISGYTAPEFDNILGEEESSLMQERDLVLRACATCQSQPGGGTTDLDVPGNAGLCTDPDADFEPEGYYWIAGIRIISYGYATSQSQKYSLTSTYTKTTSLEGYTLTSWNASSNSRYYYVSGYSASSTVPSNNGTVAYLDVSCSGTGHQSQLMYSAVARFKTGSTAASVRTGYTWTTGVSTAAHTVYLQQNEFKVFVGASTTANGKAYFDVSWASPVNKTAVTGDNGIASTYSSANTTGVTATVSRYCSNTKTGTSKPNVQLGLAPTISSHQIATGGGIEDHFTNAQTGGQNEVWTGDDLTAYGGSATRCVKYHDIMHL